MTPTINVNLKKCDCAHRVLGGPHADGCPAAPVLLPCPIPRSVTFEVVLGRHTCGVAATFGKHAPECPARPVKVSCSISGETWEGSEVDDIDAPPQIGMDRARLWNICRERWTLVKALMIGTPLLEFSLVNQHPTIELFNQRDAVFAALAKMAKAEKAMREAFNRMDPPMQRSVVEFVPDADNGPTRYALATYVSSLIEQVGGRCSPAGFVL